MIKKYFCKQILSLKKCFFFIFLLPFILNAQYDSSAYLSIKDSTTLTLKGKEFKIDSLLNAQIKDSIVSNLGYDLYDYAIWHYLNGDEEKAIIVSKNFVKVIDSLPGFDEEIHKAGLSNLGFFYDNKNDYFNAYMIYKKLCTLGTPDQYTANAYRLAGRNLRSLGDFYLASDYFESSITIAKKIKDTRVYILNSVDASINYKEMATAKSLKRSVDVLSTVIKITNNLTNDLSNEPIGISDDNKFMVYNHLGNAFNDRDDYDFKNSYLNYNKSLTIATKTNDPKLLAVAYNDLGYLYLHDKNKEALKYFNEALEQEPDIESNSIIYANISTYYLKLKNYKKSLYHIQKAIDVLSNIEENHSQSLPSKNAVSICSYKFELLQNLIGKAEIWLDFYENSNKDDQLLLNTLETLRLADYLVDIIRLESNEQQSKLFWRRTATNIYTSAVKACFYLDQPTEAFYFMEKNKALLLLEDVSLRALRENNVVPERIHQRQFDLRREILNQTNALNNSEKKDSLKSLVAASKEAYRSFVDSLQSNFKFYYRSQKSAQTISILEVQKNLSKNDNKAYIEYMLGEDRGYGLLITKTATKFFELKEYKKLFTRAVKFRTLLETPLKTKKDKEVYTEVASLLYQSLLPPEITQEIRNKKLIIIPDAYLQNIPFESLLTSLKSDSYLIKQHEINYTYSITFLTKNKIINRTNNQDFIGFAPINFKDNLSSLPASKYEIETASSLFSTTNYLYGDASTQNFIDNIKNHNIIHIASHSDATDAQRPYIVFNDKRLSLDELYLTENTADLVVLSACKTSLGSLKEGEGVMSLARGFFNTGANSVLSSLWNINDKSSSQIISDFYIEIKKGKSKSEALRTAKLNYINSHTLSNQSPYYWASFVLIGDSENNFAHSQSWFLTTPFLLLISLIIIALLFFRKIKKRNG